MSHLLGVAIESLVAILLMLTIGYCMLLNSRLKRLKADEHSLKATIAELITATEIAERAIGGLKHTVRDVNENLGNQLTSAAQMSLQLKKQLAEGDNIFRRLSRIATAARPRPSRSRSPSPSPRYPRYRRPRRLPRRPRRSPTAEGLTASPHEIVPRHPRPPGGPDRDLQPCRAEGRRAGSRWRLRLRLSAAEQPEILGPGHPQLSRQQIRSRR